MRLVVGISGGSGVIYGVRTLEVLKNLGVETHLVMSPSAKETLVLETEMSPNSPESLASFNHRFNDIAAPISSGSFRTDGMVVIPCSMKTLGGIASGYADNLLIRAADVTLKERRPLVLVIREAPFNLIHIRNMHVAARAGAIILPASPGFYHKPKTVDDMIDHVVGKALDLLGIKHDLYRRWTGPAGTKVGRS